MMGQSYKLLVCLKRISEPNELANCIADTSTCVSELL